MEKQPFEISLAAARVNASMTQEDAAKALNVTTQTVWNWENGKKEPKISQARALSKLYKIPLENIFFESEIQ